MTVDIHDVFDVFESSFRDTEIIPDGLEIEWLKRACALYSLEIEPLTFDEDMEEFNIEIDDITVETLGKIMKLLYQERQTSKANKRASIVTPDFSYDTQAPTKQYETIHLNYCNEEVIKILDSLKPTAYA